ncbi:L-seryl-tRNA(Sec) selenium transferase [Rosistilla ulvae]|uniref:L-seryl-tRNA(Sec) selenium transferase n=1 Tax=Rosistilla ulvae TaxID=1930277 RepID=A0A517M335_9BACT|nr:hypothetical protein [Rosistilla ulvae]QDS89288.1 L-seryl-tRNA(Sec) selenium transferase [Rosistilla ulvae]
MNMNQTKQNLSEWASEFLEERLSQAAATIRKPELASELRSKISDVVNSLPGSAAREVERFFDAARQHAATLADYIHPENSINTASINASGTLMLGGCGIPVALAMQHPLLFHATHQNATARNSVQRALQTASIKLTGHHVLAADSIEAAIVAVAKSERGTEIFVVPRSQAIQLPSGISLPDLLRSANCKVVEVGSVDGWSPESVRSELKDDLEKCGLVTADRIVDGTVGEPVVSEPPNDTVAGLRRLMHVAPYVAPYVAPRALDDLVNPAIPTLQQRSRDVLLITSGDGLLGGPALGLIFGESTCLQPISQSRDWCWLQADLTAQATMILALQIWIDGAAPEGSILAMLETKHANLVDRAMRIKNRLEQAGYQATVCSEQVVARLWPGASWSLPSVEIEIRPAADSNESVEALAKRLNQSNPMLLCKTTGDGVVINLRWVAPALDAKLAKVVTAGCDEMTTIPAGDGQPDICAIED